MLNQQEARRIVGACIRAVSHVSTVNMAGTLDDSQISDGGRVLRMVTLIVNNGNIGVRSLNHRISAGFFQNLGPGSPVFDVVSIVMNRATPISAFKGLAAGGATKTATKKATKTATKTAAKTAAKKSTKKAAKKSAQKAAKKSAHKAAKGTSKKTGKASKKSSK